MKRLSYSLILTYLFIILNSGGVLAQNGTGQHSLYFMGESSSYIEIPQNNSLDFTSSFTIEFWVKADELDHRFPVFSTREQNVEGAFQVEVGTGHSGHGRVSVTGHDTWLISSNDYVIPLGVWMHVAYVRDGTGAEGQTIYINGNAVDASETNDYTITNNDNPYLVAKNYAGHHFKGNVTGLRIWDGVRSGEEIKDNMHSQLDGSAEGLAGSWPLNEGSGTVANDLTSNENNGTINSAEWTDDIPHDTGDTVIDGLIGLELPESGTVTVSNTFSAMGLTFIPVDLTAEFNSSNGEYYIYGDAQFRVMDSDTVAVSLGDSSDPGIVISNNEVQRIRTSISADFTLDGVAMSPDNLGMRWSENNHLYEMYGDISIKVESSDIQFSLGTVDNPGVEIANGMLQNFDGTVTENFTLLNADIDVQDMHITYDADNSRYAISGTAGMSAAGETLQVTFEEPGIVFTHSNLSEPEIDITINSDLNFGGLEVEINNVSGHYDHTQQVYTFAGGVTVKLEGQVLDATLGKTDENGNITKEGLVVRHLDNHISHLHLYLNDDIQLNELELKTEELEIVYKPDDQFYEMSGSASADLNDFQLFFDVKDVKIENGVLDDFDLEISTNKPFSIASVEIQSKSLEFAYHNDSAKYEISGEATMTMDKKSIEIKLGTSDSPGMVIENEVLTQFEGTVAADFAIRQIEIKSDSNNPLGVKLNTQSSIYDIFGEGSVSVDDELIDITMGEENNPGIIIQHGTLQQLDMKIKADFKVKGLHFNTIAGNPLHFVWDNNSSDDIFTVNGEALLELGVDHPETFDVIFGNTDTGTNGITIKNGELTEFDIIVTSDLKFGDIEMKTNQLELFHENNVWALAGEVSLVLSSAFEVDAGFGSGDHPGIKIEIDENNGHQEIQVDELEIVAKNMNMGAFNLISGDLKIVDNALADVKLDMLFPGGMKFEAEFIFDHSVLDTVKVKWEATNPEDGIPLPGGGHIIEIDGELDNLENPHDIVFKGGLALIYGGPMTLGTQEVALIYGKAQVVIDHRHFKLDSTIKIGAYQDGDNWHHKITEADGTLEMIFHDRFTMSAELLFPNKDDKIVDVKSDVEIDSEHISAFIEIDFYAPSFIPFISGEKLFNADGALQYYHNNMNRSYVAGWTELDVKIGKPLFLGASYNFGKHHTSKLGHGDIDNIKKQVDSGQSYDFVHKASYHAKVEQIDSLGGMLPQAIIFNLETSRIGQNGQIYATYDAPDLKSNELYLILDHKPKDMSHVMKFKDYYIRSLSGKSHNTIMMSKKGTYKFLLIDKSYFLDSLENIWNADPVNEVLAPGNYTLNLKSKDLFGETYYVMNPSHVSYKSHNFYAPPLLKHSDSGVIDEGTKFSVLYDVISGNPNATWNIYAKQTSQEDSNNLILLGKDLPINHMSDNGHIIGRGIAEGFFDISHLPENKQYKTLITIDDGINKPTQSESTAAYSIQPSFKFLVHCEGGCNSDNINMAGLTIYIDENEIIQYEHGDRIATLDSNAELKEDYAVYTMGPDLPDGSHRVGMLVPNGFEIDRSKSNIKMEPDGSAWTSHPYTTGQEHKMAIYIKKVAD